MTVSAACWTHAALGEVVGTHPDRLNGGRMADRSLRREVRTRAYRGTRLRGLVTFTVGGWLAMASPLGPFTPPLPQVLGIGTMVLAVPWWAHRRRRAKVRVERKLAAWPDIARAIGLIGRR